MKILYHHRIASKDGQYVHVEEMINALSNLGHSVFVVSPQISDEKEFGSDGGMVAKLKKKLPGFIYELLEFGYSFYAYFKLCNAVRKFSPDVIYERYNLFQPAGIWVKKKFSLPLISEVNAPLFEERARYNGIALKKLAKWTECYVWKHADAVLPVTNVLANKVMSCEVNNDSITVIPNGIDPEKFNDAPSVEDAKRDLGLAGKTILGFTGFVREWHGLERVVELVAAGDEQLFLLIVGDGPARESIEKRARELNITARVRISGIVKRDKIKDYVSAFDIALQPDVVDYASPLKLFEYLFLGKAVVAPDKDNIREILTHNETGILFDPSVDKNFIDAVSRLVNDDSLRKNISASASELIDKKCLTWENNARRVIHISESLISDGVDS